MPLEENLKKAFFKVKEDIQELKKVTEAQQKALNSIFKELDAFRSATDSLHSSMSIRNEGVPQQTPNRQTTDTQQTDNNPSTIRQQPITPPTEKLPRIPDLSTFKKEINSLFSSFTERELQIFLSLYYLEEELQQPVTYPELAKKLKLSQSSVRDHVNNLLFKNAPIQKHLSTNRKVSLSIKKEFKELNLAEKLLSTHFRPSAQLSLFGT